MGSNMISKRDGLTGCAVENNLINKILSKLLSFNNVYPNVVMNITK